MLKSLRGKIVWTYAAAGLLVLALVFVQYLALRGIERGLERGDIVAALLHDSLEMRRFEKKFYLSEDSGDLLEARRHAMVALERLDLHRGEIERLASTDERRRLNDALIRYLEGLEAYPALDDRPRAQVVERIRAAGHEVSSLTKSLSQRDHDVLTERVRLSDRWLIAAGIVVLLLVLLGGYWLVRRIISPIASVELQLRAIGAGDRSQLESPSPDRELVSFTQVFNSMLQELDERQAALHRSERLAALGVLVSGVAHELNNPLGNISTSLQLVAEEGVGGDAQLIREWLQQAESEVARAQNIVRGLLHYVHQQPRLPQRALCLPLAGIVEGAVDLIRSTLPAERVTVDIPENLEVAVDPARLQQVLVNLLRNAFEASGTEPVHVLVKADSGALESLRPGGDTHVMGGLLASGNPEALVVRLTVEDDGPGIAPDALDHVFEPFFRARTEGGGSGLGLFVAQEIVQEHGGAIGVADSASGGARFSIWLPYECGQHR